MSRSIITSQSSSLQLRAVSTVPAAATQWLSDAGNPLLPWPTTTTTTTTTTHATVDTPNLTQPEQPDPTTTTAISNLLHSPTSLSSQVDHLARSHRFSAAWSLLLKTPLSPLPLPAFASLFRAYSRAHQPSSAIRSFHFLQRHHGPHSDDALDLLVDALCKYGHVTAAADYVARRRASDPEWAPSIKSYNILLNGWFRARRLKKAEKLWSEIKRSSSDVAPTVVTYGTVIEGLSRMRRPDQALALLEEMRAVAKIEPNHLTCNPIVDSLSEAGRFKEALGLVERFHLYGIEPNISTYNSLVKGFCKNGDLVGASKMLKAMIGRGIMPTPTTYNYFFRHFSKSGSIEEGMNLYTKMIESGYTPDRLTFQLLIKMLCEKERLDMAVQLIREMNQRGFESDLATSTMLVHLLCRLRRFEEACVEFEGMFKRGIVPQYISYRMLMKELKRLGMDEMERRVSELMDSVRHSTKLPGTYREREGDREGDKSVELRKMIIKKAQVMSDALKSCKDPKELKSSVESAVESANRLIDDIKRRVYAVKGG